MVVDSTVGPTSRIQASSDEISTTRIASGNKVRAFSHWLWPAPTVTGSKAEMASATLAKAAWAGCAPIRHVSSRSGHSIQQPR